jgi:L-ribulose-5-phosphate 4-epimerase
MPYEELKERVYRANLAIVEAGLVVLTWGNASGVDRAAGVMAIKPSGVAYSTLRAQDIVIVSLKDGKTLDGSHRASSDTPTHLHLYHSFESLGGIVHTHSMYGTGFAQAKRDILCLGTTHADHFNGTIPVTRDMTQAEIESEYELNTGRVIVECFEKRRINPAEVGGVLVASHAPFAWGESTAKAVENAIVLEYAAQMAIHSFALSPQIGDIAPALLHKHFFRKHGPGAYYGQAR